MHKTIKSLNTDPELLTKLDGLKERVYYQIWIKWRGSNCEHRAIMVTDFGQGVYPNRKIMPTTHVTIFNDSYEDGKIEKLPINMIYWFEVEKELFKG